MWGYAEGSEEKIESEKQRVIDSFVNYPRNG